MATRLIAMLALLLGFAAPSYADRIFLVMDVEISTSGGIIETESAIDATGADRDFADTFPYGNEPVINNQLGRFDSFVDITIDASTMALHANPDVVRIDLMSTISDTAILDGGE